GRPRISRPDANRKRALPVIQAYGWLPWSLYRGTLRVLNRWFDSHALPLGFHLYGAHLRLHALYPGQGRVYHERAEAHRQPPARVSRLQQLRPAGQRDDRRPDLRDALRPSNREIPARLAWRNRHLERTLRALRDSVRQFGRPLQPLKLVPRCCSAAADF